MAALKAEIDAETIGEIKYIESAFIVQACPENDIRMFKEKFGGAFYDLGCYCTSLMVWLLGRTPDSVKAMGY